MLARNFFILSSFTYTKKLRVLPLSFLYFRGGMI